jgi:hypothetical protein
MLPGRFSSHIRSALVCMDFVFRKVPDGATEDGQILYTSADEHPSRSLVLPIATSFNLRVGEHFQSCLPVSFEKWQSVSSGIFYLVGTLSVKEFSFALIKCQIVPPGTYCHVKASGHCRV